jgi:hypothetical protein
LRRRQNAEKTATAIVRDKSFIADIVRIKLEQTQMRAAGPRFPIGSEKPNKMSTARFSEYTGRCQASPDSRIGQHSFLISMMKGWNTQRG